MRASLCYIMVNCATFELTLSLICVQSPSSIILAIKGGPTACSNDRANCAQMQRFCTVEPFAATMPKICHICT
ncbi:unnamed protein product [Dracunculus medinensis]|uniref:Secreted protein n=1 Tax=Dracunculus medinensis TaxID=318479 RepID=A0A0N4UHC3_DRAME|nr:unnamed protein product [Dracunculus medinensis]